MTTEELYKLQTILQKLIQTGVSLEDILVNGSSGVHIEYIDKDYLIDNALTEDPDNVAARYLQEKATFRYRNTQTQYFYDGSMYGIQGLSTEEIVEILEGN